VSYGASKSGLLALSKHIATRLGKEGIRCNVVAPGLVLTENAVERNSDAERAAIFEMLRSPRFGRPEDIAAAAAFLLSQDGSWINRQMTGSQRWGGLSIAGRNPKTRCNRVAAKFRWAQRLRGGNDHAGAGDGHSCQRRQPRQLSWCE
jgi:short-subunit dehydrogenase